MSTNDICHHPDTATLLGFSAGTLNEALSAVVACHVSGCRSCAADVARMDLVGTSLVASMPVPMLAGREATGLPAMPAADQTDLKGSEDIKPAGLIPAPLRRHFGITEADIHWRQLAPGVWHHRFRLGSHKSGDLRLLRIAPGYRMLEHGHGGTELTLVLQGAFSDPTGEYLRGDLQEVAQETEHCPVADPVSGCICLIAAEERAHFRGVIGKLVQFWTGL